jgi:hypothetical protein
LLFWVSCSVRKGYVYNHYKWLAPVKSPIVQKSTDYSSHDLVLTKMPLKENLSDEKLLSPEIKLSDEKLLSPEIKLSDNVHKPQKRLIAERAIKTKNEMHKLLFYQEVEEMKWNTKTTEVDDNVLNEYYDEGQKEWCIYAILGSISALFMISGYPIVGSILGIIFSTISLIRSYKYPERYKGKSLAWVVLCLSVGVLAFMIYFIANFSLGSITFP